MGGAGGFIPSACKTTLCLDEEFTALSPALKPQTVPAINTPATINAVNVPATLLFAFVIFLS